MPWWDGEYWIYDYQMTVDVDCNGALTIPLGATDISIAGFNGWPLFEEVQQNGQHAAFVSCEKCDFESR